jgi:hypothetical protein
MALIIKINDVQITNPTGNKIEISQYPVTARVGRVASGNMTMDYVTEKKTFSFKYDVIRQDKLKTITDQVYNFEDGMFKTLSINEDGIIKEYIVYPGAITKLLFRSDNDGFWYWVGVSFQLIER